MGFECKTKTNKNKNPNQTNKRKQKNAFLIVWGERHNGGSKTVLQFLLKNIHLLSCREWIRMIPTRSLKTEGRSKGEMMKQILATIVSHGMPPTCQQRFPFSRETKIIIIIIITKQDLRMETCRDEEEGAKKTDGVTQKSSVRIFQRMRNDL